MIDPVLSLALNIQSNRGVYALLLGSGISSAAQIPTGWGITLDLITKIAVAQGDPVPDEPEQWYRSKYNEDPNYSKLLKMVGTPAERQNRLQSYFEPTDADREAGNKMPTAAHHAIAELVARGYIRIIITTNFDRLLEQALETRGVAVSVVSKPGDVEGMVPLVHQQAVLVKLHGDYRDTRIKNTQEELARYQIKMRRLLCQIIDEFGLVVCGWSAIYDTALFSAIKSNPTRRYSLYWTMLEEIPNAHAKELIDARRGNSIRISSADQFFLELAEKVTAVEELSVTHPLTVGAAVATLKRYLAEARHKIRLQDFLISESRTTKKNLWKVQVQPYPDMGPYFARCREATRLLTQLIAHASVWTRDNDQLKLLASCIRAITALPDPVDYSAGWQSIFAYTLRG